MQKPVILAAVTVGIVAIGAIAWYALANSNSNNPSNATPTPTSTPAVATSITPTVTVSPTISATPKSSPKSRSTKEFRISGSGHSFSTTKLTVDQGDTVKVVFTATDTGHSFTLPEFDVDTGIVGAGQTKTVEFTANKKGSFEFYCIPHRSMGMKGTLEVR